MTLRRAVLGLLALLLLPAGLLTCARLLDPGRGALVRVVAFTPYAVPLYALAGLVLAAAWWRGGGRWRTAAKAGVVVAAAGLLAHLLWAGGWYVGPSPATADGGTTLRVMTANLHLGEADPAEVVATAVQHRADVVVLEEVTPEERYALRAAGLADVFPHHAGRPGPGGTGTMVYSRLRIDHVRRLHTSLAGYRAVVHVGRHRVGLLAVHVRPPDLDAAEWAADLDVVRTAAVGLRGPAMIVGDFNATPDHLPLRDLRGRGFDDAATEAHSGWQPTWPSDGLVSVLGFRLPPLLRIDHVLVDDRIRAVSTESVPVLGSDHRALVAILSL